ncbi:MAG TPA: type II secretion system protein GspL [Allosphingosinicella sp.]|nr:type II secretion system protein GspL [Allosphingosinicella sp.]
MTEGLLIFLAPEGGIAGWLGLKDGIVDSRGTALDGARLNGGAAAAVVPGEQVTLHWLELPGGLAPAQAQAAARLMAVEASAQSIAEMHVAVGEGEGGALRPVALVPTARMEAWLETLRAAGVEPDLMLPDTALLPVPEEGLVRFEREALSLYRGREAAFAAEPELAALVVGDAPVAQLEAGGFEPGLAAALARPLVNLRQGPFARRREWRLQGARLRRLAILACALLAATLALQVVQIAVYTLAADRAEEETRRIAAAALSRSPGAAGAADLTRRLAEIRGGGIGFAGVAGAVFAAVRAAPNVELSSMTFAEDGSLRVSALADGAPSLTDFTQRVEAAGFRVEAMPPRTAGARQSQDLVVRPR